MLGSRWSHCTPTPGDSAFLCSLLVNPTSDWPRLSETMALQEIFTIAEQLRPTIVLRWKEVGKCFFQRLTFAFKTKQLLCWPIPHGSSGRQEAYPLSNRKQNSMIDNLLVCSNASILYERALKVSSLREFSSIGFSSSRQTLVFREDSRELSHHSSGWFPFSRIRV